MSYLWMKDLETNVNNVKPKQPRGYWPDLEKRITASAFEKTYGIVYHPRRWTEEPIFVKQFKIPHQLKFVKNLFAFWSYST